VENTKKSKEEQQYDSYWKLTVEYSDIHGTLFTNVLNLLMTITYQMVIAQLT